MQIKKGRLVGGESQRKEMGAGISLVTFYESLGMMNKAIKEQRLKERQGMR